jgi:predicted GNAT family N-acyltransferase
MSSATPTPAEEYLAHMSAGTTAPKAVLDYAARCVINPTPPRSASLPLRSSDAAVEVCWLADRMEFQPQVATAQFNEWKDIYTGCFGVHSAEENIKHHAETYCNKDQLNSTLVWLIDGKLAATAMVNPEDVQLGQPYWGVQPWITCVFVFEEFRGRGLVKVVIDTVAARVRDWGYQHLWLITQHLQEVYQRYGFKSIETVETYRHYYTVMRRDFGHEGKKALTEQDAKDAHRALHPERY